jgi:hypothetical protein
MRSCALAENFLSPWAAACNKHAVHTNTAIPYIALRIV